MHLLRTPRWIAFTLVAIVFSAVCLAFGWWQGTRTLTILEAERAAVSEPVDVLDVADTGAGLAAGSIGRPVIVTGEYVAAEQIVVVNRELDGRPGAWVVTPLRTADGGIWVPVVRGWVPSVDAPGVQVPPGEVVVTGVVQPYEEFYREAPRRPDGSYVAVSRPALAEDWGAQTLAGVVVLREQRPVAAPAPEPVPPTVQTADVPFPLQNAAYTLQWAVFAAVVWAMWLRWLRLDLRRERDEKDSAATDTVVT